MKEKIIILKVLLFSFLIVLLSCFGEPTKPGPYESYISVSGDVSESYEISAEFISQVSIFSM